MTTTIEQPTQTVRSARTALAREIDAIYRPPPVHWVGDGFRVSGYFDAIAGAVRKLDPFLMLDYHPPYDYSPSSKPRGVSVHPHRGFETVTIVWDGRVAHHDSSGAGGVIGPGDVQWMTAGAGILHKEYHEEEFSRAGGTFHVAQLWVNLPRAHKDAPPSYQSLTGADMGRVELAGGAGVVRVIAGEHAGVRGPAKTFTPITLLDAELGEGKTLAFSLPAEHNAALLVIAGEVTLNGSARTTTGDFVLFKNVGSEIAVAAHTAARLLVLGGQPIGEPVVQYGPFVMTSEREIAQAFADYHAGRYGALED